MTRLLVVIALIGGLLGPVACSYGGDLAWENYQEDVTDAWSVEAKTSGLKSAGGSSGGSQGEKNGSSPPSFVGFPISPIRFIPGSRGHGDPKTW